MTKAKASSYRCLMPLNLAVTFFRKFDKTEFMRTGNLQIDTSELEAKENSVYWLRTARNIDAWCLRQMFGAKASIPATLEEPDEVPTCLGKSSIQDEKCNLYMELIVQFETWLKDPLWKQRPLKWCEAQAVKFINEGFFEGANKSEICLFMDAMRMVRRANDVSILIDEPRFNEFDSALAQDKAMVKTQSSRVFANGSFGRVRSQACKALGYADSGIECQRQPRQGGASTEALEMTRSAMEIMRSSLSEDHQKLSAVQHRHADSGRLISRILSNSCRAVPPNMPR